MAGPHDDTDVPLGRVGRYALQRELARGGMGVVYEARDVELGRRVAVKLLADSDAPRRVERLHREAALAAGLDHPGIVRVHEVGQAASEDGGPARHYIVMELVDGGDLATRMHDLPRDTRIQILRQVAEATAHAHAHGVIHRDLKPANVLLAEDGRVLVADFGLARRLEDTRLTHSGQQVGTPYYLAPELLDSATRRPPDAQADVWALGVMLYELLTGERPFGGAAAAEVYAGIRSRDPGPGLIRRGVPPPLTAVCLRALEKDPARRYADAGALAADLARWQRGEPVQARAPSAARRISRAVGRHPWRVLLATLVALGLTLGVGQRRATARRLQRAGQLAGEARASLAAGEWATAIARARQSLELAADPRLIALIDTAQARHDAARRAAERQRARTAARQALTQELAAVTTQIHHTRSLFYVRDAALREALDALDVRLSALESRPDPPPELANLAGVGRYVLGQPARAEALLKRAEAAGALDAEGRYTLGRIYQERAMLAFFVGGSPERSLALSRAAAEQALKYLDAPLTGWDAARALDRQVVRAYRAMAQSRRRECGRLIDEALARFAGQPGLEAFWHLRALLGGVDNALQAHTAALAIRPHDAWSLYFRGLLRKQTGDLPGALADLDHAIRIRPHVHHAYQSRANVLSRLGRKAEARRDLDRAVDIAPEDPTLREARAGLRREAGDLPGALSDLDRALVALPASARLRRARSSARRAAGDLDGALADSRRAVQLEPESPRGYRERAAVRRARGDTAAAAADAQRARALDRNPTQDPLRQAAQRMARGDVRGAIVELSAALSRTPDDVGLRIKRATAYLMTRQPGRARADLDRIIAREPPHWRPLALRADAWALAGDLTRAIADYDRALALSRGNASVLTRRGLARYRRGELKAALADYDAALATAPRDSRCLIHRGDCHLRMGRFDAARRDFERAAQLDPRNAQPRIGLAFLTAHEGDVARGRTLLSEALRGAPPQAVEGIRRAFRAQFGGAD